MEWGNFHGTIGRRTDIHPGARVQHEQQVPAEVVQVELRWGRGGSLARSHDSNASRRRSRPRSEDSSVIEDDTIYLSSLQ